MRKTSKPNSLSIFIPECVEMMIADILHVYRLVNNETDSWSRYLHYQLYCHITLLSDF